MRIGLEGVVLAVALGAHGSQPARLSRGEPPPPLPRLHGQCHVVFDVGVDARGSVTGVRFLYGNDTLARALEEVVARWSFEPATEEGRPAESRVLVAALFAALYALGPCSPPEGTPLAPVSVPVPAALSPPAYPARALGYGAVIVEVEVGPSGEVRSAQAVGDRTPFDGVAEQAARAWRFVPGSQRGAPAPTLAYLVFGFPEPVLAVGTE